MTPVPKEYLQYAGRIIPGRKFLRLHDSLHMTRHMFVEVRSVRQGMAIVD